MNDIVEQLRHAADDTDAVKNASVAYLLEHAAGEIELLRGYRDEAESDAAVARMLVERLRLTDAEREAVEWCRDNITAMAHPSSAFAHIHAHSLRGLLARCAIGHQE